MLAEAVVQSHLRWKLSSGVGTSGKEVSPRSEHLQQRQMICLHATWHNVFCIPTLRVRKTYGFSGLLARAEPFNDARCMHINLKLWALLPMTLCSIRMSHILHLTVKFFPRTSRIPVPSKGPQSGRDFRLHSKLDTHQLLGFLPSTSLLQDGAMRQAGSRQSRRRDHGCDHDDVEFRGGQGVVGYRIEHQ